MNPFFPPIKTEFFLKSCDGDICFLGLALPLVFKNSRSTRGAYLSWNLVAHPLHQSTPPSSPWGADGDGIIRNHFTLIWGFGEKRKLQFPWIGFPHESYWNGLLWARSRD